MEPKVWIGDLRAYNEGNLHGAWYDLAEYMDGDELLADVEDMLMTGSGGEEWYIADYEGFGELRVDHINDLDQLVNLARAIEEHGDILAAYIDYIDPSFKYGDLWEYISKFEEAYLGEYSDVGDYAHRLAEDGVLTDEFLRRYVDWKQMGEEMEINGDIFVVEKGPNEVHVFDALV